MIIKTRVASSIGWLSISFSLSISLSFSLLLSLSLSLSHSLHSFDENKQRKVPRPDKIGTKKLHVRQKCFRCGFHSLDLCERGFVCTMFVVHVCPFFLRSSRCSIYLLPALFFLLRQHASIMSHFLLPPVFSCFAVCAILLSFFCTFVQVRRFLPNRSNRTRFCRRCRCARSFARSRKREREKEREGERERERERERKRERERESRELES
jgi:hypothetical protein